MAALWHRTNNGRLLLVLQEYSGTGQFASKVECLGTL
jgi:hypothetical protein